MIEELKLIERSPSNPNNQTSFDGNADIIIDKYGQFERCTGEEGLVQNLIKAILTSHQLDNYGTLIRSLLHKKNLSFIRGRIMVDLLNSFSVLRKYQLKYYQDFPTFDTKNIIMQTYEVFVNRLNALALLVNIKVQSLYNQKIQSNSLQEINEIQIR